MVLHSQYSTLGFLGTGNEEVLVDGLEGEGIHHPNVGTTLQELGMSLYGLFQSNPTTDYGDLVLLGLPHNLRQKKKPQSVNTTSKKALL